MDPSGVGRPGPAWGVRREPGTLGDPAHLHKPEGGADRLTGGGRTPRTTPVGDGGRPSDLAPNWSATVVRPMVPVR